MPSRGRPHNLERFIAAYKDTQAQAPVVVMLDEDDPSLDQYKEIDLPENFLLQVSDKAKDGGIVALFNDFFDNNPNLDWYASVGDDVVPYTHMWDRHLINSCGKDGISWARDGFQNHHLPTHPFIGGDLVREWGFIAPRTLKHYYADNFWRDELNKRGCGMYREDVLMEHMHAIAKKAPLDDTYTEGKDIEADRKAYEDLNNRNN